MARSGSPKAKWPGPNEIMRLKSNGREAAARPAVCESLMAAASAKAGGNRKRGIENRLIHQPSISGGGVSRQWLENSESGKAAGEISMASYQRKPNHMAKTDQYEKQLAISGVSSKVNMAGGGIKCGENGGEAVKIMAGEQLAAGESWHGWRKLASLSLHRASSMAAQRRAFM